MLIYVDASVFGGVFDPEFEQASRDFSIVFVREHLKWQSALLCWKNSNLPRNRCDD